MNDDQIAQSMAVLKANPNDLVSSALAYEWLSELVAARAEIARLKSGDGLTKAARWNIAREVMSASLSDLRASNTVYVKGDFEGEA
jgi:hypothetical protein